MNNIKDKEEKNNFSWVTEYSKYTGIFLFIGTIYGVIYNFVAYNLVLGFDIFAYIEPFDLILSLISNNNIVSFSLSCLIFYFLFTILEQLSYTGKLLQYRGKISFFTVFIIIIILFLMYNNLASVDTISNKYTLMPIFLILFANMLSWSRIKETTPKKVKYLTIIIVQVIVVGILGAYSSLVLLNKNHNEIKQISLIKGDKSILKNKNFQFITRTSSSTILFTYEKENKKKNIIVFNNADISTMTYK